MSDFDACVTWILQQEDAGLTGKVVNLFDGAGLTRFGIGQHSSPGIPADFYTCSVAQALEEAKTFYRANFWDRFLGDSILSDEVAATILSFSVNSGLQTTIILLQQVLGFQIRDGIMGPVTLAAVNKMGPPLAAQLRAAQANFYKMLVAKQPTDARFLAGWLARANRIYPSLA
jgi:lysozyme family protein